MSRRRFLRSLAAAPLLPTVLAQAPTPPSPAPPAPSPTPAIPSPASPVPSPSPSPPGPVAQALGDVVRIHYGAQLEEADPGLRPTYGLVSRHGAMALCWTLDKLGPMCRTADDCGLVLSVIAGKDPADPTTGAGDFDYPVRGTRAGGTRRRFRIGVVKNATERAQPEVKENFRRSLSVLRSFAKLDEDVEFPDFPWSAAVGIIVDAEGASAFRDLIESGGTRKLRAAADRVGGYSAIMTLAVDYLQAMRARVPMRAALDALLSRYDALVTPHGLPTSLQLIGRAFSEVTLIAIADRYQQATDWHRKRPTLTN